MKEEESNLESESDATVKGGKRKREMKSTSKGVSYKTYPYGVRVVDT